MRNNSELQDLCRLNAERMDLEQFMTGKDYPSLYCSIRRSGNAASDERLVKYILEENGYKNWPTLSRVKLQKRGKCELRGLKPVIFSYKGLALRNLRPDAKI